MVVCTRTTSSEALTMTGRMRACGQRSRLGRPGQLRRALASAVLLGSLLLVPVAEQSTTAYADQIDMSGEVTGPDVEGTIWLTFDPDGGDVTGRIEMMVTFDCRGKSRDEHHVLEIAKGHLDGDRLVATAVY